MGKSKSKIFIQGPGMELGGIERSLLGLLDSINYDKYDVDLMLFSHDGELMKYINPRVSLLPECKMISLYYKNINVLIKEFHFFVIFIKLVSKLIYKYHKVKGYGADDREVYIEICSYFYKKSKKQYDLALGFFEPFFYIEKNIESNIKVGWVHTDYSVMREKFNYIPAPEIWRRVDKIVCVSDDVKKSFDAMYPGFGYKSIVIENILSTSFITTSSNEFEVNKEMDKSSYCILSIGRFSQQKNFLQALDACKILKDQNYDFKWYFIGYGPQEQKMIEKIHSLCIDDVAVILGKKDNPYPYIKACDLYVQPSILEGKSLSVREAQILRKPVLVTNFPTANSQINNGFDGYICEMSLNGIVEGLKYMINNSELCNRLIINESKCDYSYKTEINKIFTLI